MQWSGEDDAMRRPPVVAWKAVSQIHRFWGLGPGLGSVISEVLTMVGTKDCTTTYDALAP
eukprot:6394024-Amphidinium_carterae.1